MSFVEEGMMVFTDAQWSVVEPLVEACRPHAKVPPSNMSPTPRRNDLPSAGAATLTAETSTVTSTIPIIAAASTAAEFADRSLTTG